MRTYAGRLLREANGLVYTSRYGHALPADHRAAARVVSDGDTIDVLDNAKTTYRIRLAGIDAARAGPAVLPAALFECCFGKIVTVRVLGKDNHGRIIGHVSVDGDAACLSLLQAGWLSLIHDQSPEYAAAAERGLDPRPIPPWE